MKDSGTNMCDHDSNKLCLDFLDNGVGEILVNNIDNDGGLLGYDIELIKSFTETLNCPVLVLGGAGKWEHIQDLFEKTSSNHHF